VEEIEVDAPRHGEVTVRLAACGVCHSDLSATNGTIAYPLPLVLGHEGAGVVTAVGEGVSRYTVGDHVVSSFVSMCGRCRYCQTGRPQLCVQSLQALYTLPDGTVRTHDAAGQSLNVFCGCGVMAELATLHADNLVKIDEQMPLDRAALIGCGVMTGVGAAVNTAAVEAGELVVGAVVTGGSPTSITPGSTEGVPFMMRSQSPSGSLALEDVLSGAAGTQDARATFGTATDWYAVVATFHTVSSP